jgi:cytochrome P450
MVTAPNIQDPAFLENPVPFYEIGRRMSPLYVENMNLWMAFGYDECLAILRDNAQWKSGPPAAMLADPSAPQPSMLGSDPPRHTRLRALVSQAFTPRMIEQLEPRLRQIAAGLLDEVLPAGQCDLVETLTYPLPVIAIAEILGVEPEKRSRFKVWSDEVVATLGGPDQDGVPRDIRPETAEEMREYFRILTEERRANPRSDLISGLVQAEIDGEKLNFDELFQMFILLLVAGNETTTNLIGNAVQEFMAHPEQLVRVEADHSLIPSALEEVLRINSPVQATVRRAKRDIEFNGKQISEDQQIVVWLAAANRDPAQFPEPDRLDVGRSPNHHVGLGAGLHFCVGAPLARLEAKIAFTTLLRRFPELKLAAEEVAYRGTFNARGPVSLPVTF